MRVRHFSQPELNRFKQFQQQSFDTLEEIAATLKAGDTEIQVARRIRKAFHLQGVHLYFHVPVVLFGERTAYPGNFGQFEALATDQTLQTGMPVILDAAPIYQGHMVDTSLSLAFGANLQHEKMMGQLQPFREQILKAVRNGDGFQAIEKQVDANIRALGYENCHRKHIGAVLGHRLTRVADTIFNRLKYKQLSVRQVAWFFYKSFLARKGWQNDSPNWNHFSSSDHPPAPGLWAVEPHFAGHQVGVKFEEILVITKDDAYWLDDDLPHCRAWG